jgi:hypothetical protein
MKQHGIWLSLTALVVSIALSAAASPSPVMFLPVLSAALGTIGASHGFRGRMAGPGQAEALRLSRFYGLLSLSIVGILLVAFGAGGYLRRD